jgi:hypothetical protein
MLPYNSEARNEVGRDVTRGLDAEKLGNFSKNIHDIISTAVRIREYRGVTVCRNVPI